MKLDALAQRYGLSEAMMAEFLKNHYEDINANGEYLKNVNKEWILEDNGLSVLDGMLKKPEPVISPDVKALQETNATLKQQVVQLKQENDKLSEDFRHISQQLADMRKERKPFDDALAHYQQMVESSRAESLSYQQHLNTLKASQAQNSEEYVRRINDLTEELERQKKMVSGMQQVEFQRMELQKQVTQLYQKNEAINKRCDALKAERDAAILESEQNKKYAREVKEQTSLAVCSLAAAENELVRVAKISPNELDAAKKNFQAHSSSSPFPFSDDSTLPSASTPEPVKKNEPTGREKQEAHQQALMDELRKQSAPKRGLFSRISGFLGMGSNKAAL